MTGASDETGVANYRRVMIVWIAVLLVLYVLQEIFS